MIIIADFYKCGLNIRLREFILSIQNTECATFRKSSWLCATPYENMEITTEWEVSEIVEDSGQIIIYCIPKEFRLELDPVF